MSTRSSHSPVPLRVELKPSRRLQGALVALAAGVLVAVARADLPVALQLALGVALALHLVFLLRREACRSGVLLWRGEHWLWVAESREQLLYLCQATAWRGLIVLRFRERAGGAAQVFTLLPDSAARDELRRLRVWLRHLPVFDGENDGESGGDVAP